MEDRTMLSTMLWANSSGGVWDVASNWVNQANPADQHVPTSSDDAEIDYSGITVTFSSGAADSVNNLTSQATLNLSSGTLNVSGTIQAPGGQLLLQGATLGGASIAAGTTLVGSSGTLDGVTIDGDLTVSGDNAVSVQDGLTLNGTAALGDNSSVGYLNFNGSQTLGGTGTVVLGSATYRTYYGYTYYNGLFDTTAGDTLTVGPGVAVRGGLGYIGYASYQGSAGGSLINEGTIQADVSGETITINVTGVQNVGSLEVQNGATLSLQTTVDNSGTVSVDGVSFVSGGGTIVGGALATQTGASVSNVTLDGVTVSGNWQVTGDNAVTVEDGLTLHGTLSLGDSSTVGYLNFNGSQTLGGTGAVVFGSATYRTYYYGYTYYNGLFVTTAGDTLTIGPSVTVSGSLGAIGYESYQGSPGGSVINQGTIEWVNGASLLIPGSLTNDGTITVDAASTMAPGGTIVGGTIITQTGAEVGGVTLDGVTVDGNWQIVSDYSVSVLDGLTVNGILTLGDSSTVGYLNFSGSQTLGGVGTVVLGSATYRTYYGYTYYNGLFDTTSRRHAHGGSRCRGARRSGVHRLRILPGLGRRQPHQRGDHPGRCQRRDDHDQRDWRPERWQPRGAEWSNALAPDHGRQLRHGFRRRRELRLRRGHDRRGNARDSDWGERLECDPRWRDRER